MELLEFSMHIGLIRLSGLLVVACTVSSAKTKCKSIPTAATILRRQRLL